MSEVNPASEVNPYSPTQQVTDQQADIRKVSVQPIQLIRRGHALLGDQYWLFLGITLVAILIGSAVPFGLIMGAMMTGIYLCYIERERGRQVEFATLFKSFDQFVDTLLAWLVMLAVSMAVIIPFMILVFALVMFPIIQSAQTAAANNAPPPQPDFPIIIFVLYPVMIIVNVAITLPFIFVFQLIADRKVKAMEAVKLSFRGVWKNLLGIIWFFVVLMFISMILTLMCYIPALLFMPISFGAMYLLYRDIYGPLPAENAQPAG